ncbi:MAG: hypothetical protein GEU81_11170 [Nitriliruptorales bacterium]|nr:hypothetical protein [Nitriliruptorales bacterium]
MTLSIDPITFEVIKHRLWQITDEQAIAIKTISASPIVVEGNDFNVGIFTPDGRTVTAGFGSLVHVTTMGDALEGIRRLASTIEDGDVFLTNDPFVGALHQNDVVVASPLFRDGELIMWVGNVLHHADVGGIDEGSFCINARSLYQEPARYFLKLVSAGVLSTEVEHTFVTNSRLSDAVALDLRAQLGAINVARTRLNELLDEVGVEQVQATMQGSLDTAGQLLRERISSMDDGRWETDVYMDGARVGCDELVRVHLALIKSGDRLTFDFTGSSPQVDAAVNSTYHATYAGSTVPIYTFLCASDIDWNDAVKSCVRVVAPPGLVVSAVPPAPVSICTVGFRWLVTVAASRVVAEMLAANEQYLDRVCPTWSVSANCNNVFATGPDGRLVGALLSDHRAGGAGGRSFADGISHAGQQTSFASYVANVESAESKLPILYVHRRQLPDSGGAGRYRGGLTAEVALVPFGTDELLLKSTNTAGTDQTNAGGISGGYPGAGSQVSIVRESGVRAALAAGQLPETQDWPEPKHLPAKAQAHLGPDDVLIFHPPGGGGFGDPLERDLDAVQSDLDQGRVTAAWAEASYGAVLTSAGQVDRAASQRRRSQLRAGRIPHGRTMAVPASVPAGRTIGDALVLVDGADGDVLACRQCGHVIGPAPTDQDADVVRSRQPLGAAGPWLAVRYGGTSPNFVLTETACPSCGKLLDVREERVVSDDHRARPVEV